MYCTVTVSLPDGAGDTVTVNPAAVPSVTDAPPVTDTVGSAGSSSSATSTDADPAEPLTEYAALLSTVTVTEPSVSSVVSASVGTDTDADPDDPTCTCFAPRSPDATKLPDWDTV